MLVAGQAEPNSDITIMNGKQPIGTAKADDAGAFVILPDNPLQGGDNQISISSKLTDGTTIISEQQVAVAVPEQGEALVALVEPGKPVEIIQKPEPVAVANVPDPEPEVAPKVVEEAKQDTAPVTVVEKTKPEPEETVVAKVQEAAEDVKAEPVEPEPVEPKSVESGSVEPEPTPTPEAIQKPLEEAREESKKRVARLLLDEAKEQSAPIADEIIVKAPEESSAQTSAVPAPAAEAPIVEQVAAVAEENDVAPAQAVKPPKTISVEAVEVENDTLFVAGKASPNETVRVYVDDQLVVDIKTGEGGQWLLEKTKPLGPGEYNIRVDLLKQGSGEVVARAAVPFAVEDLTPAELADAKVGNVIIRKNDNLWTIAQRLYGDGRRYTSIYQQNKGQIKNPELIFPGQIFVVPGEGQVPGAASIVDQAVVIAPAAKPETQ